MAGQEPGSESALRFPPSTALLSLRTIRQARAVAATRPPRGDYLGRDEFDRPPGAEHLGTHLHLTHRNRSEDVDRHAADRGVRPGPAPFQLAHQEGGDGAEVLRLVRPRADRVLGRTEDAFVELFVETLVLHGR
jgi:hypothetical protein